VREWWGDPVRGLARIAEHIVDPAIDALVVEYNDLPICTVQEALARIVTKYSSFVSLRQNTEPSVRC
jgi:hypothetical protein